MLNIFSVQLLNIHCLTGIYSSARNQKKKYDFVLANSVSLKSFIWEWFTTFYHC